MPMPTSGGSRNSSALSTGGGGGSQNTSALSQGPPTDAAKVEAQKETFKLLKEMSDLLHTGLDTEGLGICLRLCEEGVNPVALAKLIKDWRTKGAINDAST